MPNFFECTVGEYMSRQPKTVAPGLSLGALEKLFEELDFNAFPVTHDGTPAGRLVGFVTKFDFLKAFVMTTHALLPHYDALMAKTVGDVMTTTVQHVTDTTPLTRVLQQMIDTRARSVPVLDASGKLVGMLSRTNIMRALKESTTA